MQLSNKTSSIHLQITIKQILSLVFTWTLYSSAGGLKCETCSSLSFSSNSSQQCSSETIMCFTASAHGSVGQSPISLMKKGCAHPPICPTTGYHNYSLTTVSVSLMVEVECCNTDDCNSAMLSFPQTLPDIKLMCCSSADCGATVKCLGLGNRCFQANVTIGSDPGTYFGCASDNLCINVTSQGSFPVIPALLNISITDGVQCCSTNLCNNVTTTATPNTTALSTAATTTAATTTAATTTAATTTAVTTTASTTTIAMTISNACSPSLALMSLLLGLCHFW